MEIIMRDDPAKRDLFGWFSLGIVIILKKIIEISHISMLFVDSSFHLKTRILQPTKCVKPWGFFK